MSCRVIINLLADDGRDINGVVEQQAIAALAAALGVRAFTETWRLSIEDGETFGSIAFTIQGPGFSRRFRYTGLPNQVGRFIKTQVLAAVPP